MKAGIQDGPTEAGDGVNGSSEAADGGDSNCLSLPVNWTSQQWRELKSRNTCLFNSHGKLGCTIFRDTKTLLFSEKVIGTHFSEEWINGVNPPTHKKGCVKFFINTAIV